MTPTMASRIRRARTMARISQSQLAAQVGVTRSAVAQWEGSTSIVPSVNHLCRIAVATRVPFEWLATGRGSSKVEGEQAIDLAEVVQSEIEADMLALLRRLSTRRQAVVRDMVQLMLK